MPEDKFRPAPRIVVRGGDLSDIDDLVWLEAKAFRSERLSVRRLKAHLVSPNASLLVARAGKKLAGYSLVLTRRGSTIARLYSIAVDPEQAGRGVGLRLLTAAERAAAERGALSIRLEVRTDNQPAIRLYEKHGYRRIGTVQDYYEDGAAAYRYQRELGRAGRTRSTAGAFRRAA